VKRSQAGKESLLVEEIKHNREREDKDNQGDNPEFAVQALILNAQFIESERSQMPSQLFSKINK
jgi:hypothetical protein